MDTTRALLDRCDFPPAGTPVTLGVSGGADSAALVVLAVAAGCRATVVHVDHGLRDGSAAEASVVAGLAGRFGCAFRSVPVALADGPNLEARARAARYDALGPDALVGHTLDDRVETILLHLLRGTGADGFAALRPGDPRRPMLRLRRAETVALCRELDIEVVEDPSNVSPRFTRNRVRNELVPLLDDISGRDTAVLVARTADLIAADGALLDELAADIDPTDAEALRVAARPLSSRAVRRWLGDVHDGYAPDAAEIDRVLDVAAGGARATELVGGARLQRTNRRLRVVEASDDPPTDSDVAT